MKRMGVTWMIGLLAGLLGTAFVSPAEAQAERRLLSAAQSLSCLVRPERAPRYPARSEFDRGTGRMRVKLSFTQPDAPPTAEVLFNSAREDMQSEVHAYLKQYRLPCLTADDGVVTAVQEFSFSNSDRAPTPLPAEPPDGAPPLCVVMPRRDMPYWQSFSDEVEHVVVAVTFTGDGRQPPQVKVMHSSASRRTEDSVLAWLDGYRMPCRKGTEPPQGFRQHFRYVPQGHQPFVFKREGFGLVEFLRMTRKPQALRAAFDFRTMSCPFKVEYTVYGGAVPNEAIEAGQGARPDPNKAAFLGWLASLELGFNNASQANDLFGSVLQIDVPCGTLNLGKTD